jgi:hypothetical protein
MCCIIASNNLRRREAALTGVPDLVGVITVNVYMLLIIAICAARISGRDELARWTGIASSLVLIPLVCLLIVAFNTDRNGFYFVWLGLIITFALFELIADSILQIDFHYARWAIISYVTLFFIMILGIIGISAQAGQAWFIATIVTLIMAVLAFVLRGIYGL